MNLGKRFRMGSREPYLRFSDIPRRLFSTVAGRMRGGAPKADASSLWALKDVSFEVKRGEVVGIIGRNGAGKSTLLKILSRITKPTEGEVQIRGRIGSLLEVGTGFHPELTGRENIYLNGTILGMRKSEIDRKFDEIVAFSEIERFLDTPVKHYSSGMYMRLAFAVAAHLEAEILLVDEVLAVGDAQFQKKCLGKMGEVAREGRTVLFVSHNMVAVESLCARAMWLRGGQLVEQGSPHEVVSSYQDTTFAAAGEFAAVTQQIWSFEESPGNAQVRIHRAEIRPTDGTRSERISVNTPLEVAFAFWNLVPSAQLNLSVLVADELGTPRFVTVPVREPRWNGRPFPRGMFRNTFQIPQHLLNNGIHRIHLYVVRDQNVVIYQHEDILVFEVRDDPNLREHWFGKWSGAVRPDLKWTIELVSESTGTESLEDATG